MTGTWFLLEQDWLRMGLRPAISDEFTHIGVVSPQDRPAHLAVAGVVDPPKLMHVRVAGRAQQLTGRSDAGMVQAMGSLEPVGRLVGFLSNTRT